MRKSRFIALAPFLALFAGCQTWYGFTDRVTREYQWADPVAAARENAEKPERKLLAWSSGGMVPLKIPGLTKREVVDYVDSGKIKIEVFYNDHLDFFRGGSKEAYRVRAKYRYAEKFNRALLEKFRSQEERHTSSRRCKRAGSKRDSHGPPPLTITSNPEGLILRSLARGASLTFVKNIPWNTRQERAAGKEFVC